MSTSTDIQQSRKKRKVESDTLQKSKKRRKHAEPQEESSSQTLPVKDKKSRKKDPKDEEARDDDVDMVNGDVAEPQSSQTVEEGIPLRNRGHEESMLQDIPVPDTIEETDTTLLSSKDPTCFYSKRLSLYVPIPAVSLSTTTSSLLSLHLAPLLLSYFPPLGGVVLAFSDAVLTAKPENGVNLPLQPPSSGDVPRNPPDETFAQCADQFGVCWVWLTATFLVFAPQPGDKFHGWANIQSESFIGLVSYNYFQTSVLKSRIPQRWTFDGPSREQKNKRKPRKGKLQGQVNGEEAASQPVASSDTVDLLDGSFVDEHGDKVNQKQLITVNDIDMTPGSDRSRFGLQIDGSLLSPEEEEAVTAEAKRQYEAREKRKTRSHTPAMEDSELPLMSGGIALNGEADVA